MTVAELITELQQVDQHAEVCVAKQAFVDYTEIRQRRESCFSCAGLCEEQIGSHKLVYIDHFGD